MVLCGSHGLGEEHRRWGMCLEIGGAWAKLIGLGVNPENLVLFMPPEERAELSKEHNRSLLDEIDGIPIKIDKSINRWYIKNTEVN